MKFERKYRLVRLKVFFDTGIALTSYPIKILLVVGIGFAVDDIKNISFIIAAGFLYGIFCFILGWMWYKYKWMDAQWEVSNNYNPFVKQMRRSSVLKGTN